MQQRAAAAAAATRLCCRRPPLPRGMPALLLALLLLAGLQPSLAAAAAAVEEAPAVSGAEAPSSADEQALWQRDAAPAPAPGPGDGADGRVEAASLGPTLQYPVNRNRAGQPVMTVTKLQMAGKRLVYWEVPQAPVGVLFFFHGCHHTGADQWHAQPGCPECRGGATLRPDGVGGAGRG